LKTLSLWQPWATLIAIGAKQYETRSWATSYRGPLLIHAAKRWDFIDQMHPATEEPIISMLRSAGITKVKQLPFGAVVCMVNLLDCIPTEQIKSKLEVRERAVGDYRNGRFAWKLELVSVFDPPVAAVGRQRLFETRIAI
jgi:activating signal cointegrator 1